MVRRGRRTSTRSLQTMVNIRILQLFLSILSALNCTCKFKRHVFLHTVRDIFVAMPIQLHHNFYFTFILLILWLTKYICRPSETTDNIMNLQCIVKGQLAKIKIYLISIAPLILVFVRH
jgi:hypothetical protein